eukprot:TRINITY_DN10179_c0_g1_i2.p2 TRINITY_DN10179_c0_g1~~TRINITY_DN10179_c0_g1_i2.p2  ORF type:complete len:215 (-),score=7.65 TRINITY_DN10179_c0_g1_i2:140-742(-)
MQYQHKILLTKDIYNSVRSVSVSFSNNNSSIYYSYPQVSEQYSGLLQIPIWDRINKEENQGAMKSLQELKEYATAKWNEMWGPELPDMPREATHGPGWSISVRKNAVRDPTKGINDKTTTVHAFARKSSGETIDRTFGPYTSNSWRKNEMILYPQVNEWCESVSGNNPYLKERAKKAIKGKPFEEKEKVEKKPETIGHQA